MEEVGFKARQCVVFYPTILTDKLEEMEEEAAGASEPENCIPERRKENRKRVF